MHLVGRGLVVCLGLDVEHLRFVEHGSVKAEDLFVYPEGRVARGGLGGGGGGHCVEMEMLIVCGVVCAKSSPEMCRLLGGSRLSEFLGASAAVFSWSVCPGM